MCLLMVTMGELPKREFLVNASVNNPDGYGFAVNHGDHIVTGRSMQYENLIDRFYAEMAKSDTPVGMFHARYTTHGKTMLENNHPFRVDGRKDIVLAHNGMLPIVPRLGDDRSDTRIFAEDVLGAIGVESLDDKDTFRRLEDFTAGSKVAILSTTKDLRDPVYILNEHLGHWDNNIWWSNSGYQTRYTYNYSTSYYGGSWDSESDIIGYKKNWWEKDYTASDTVIADPCYVCGNVIDDEQMVEQMCTVCNSCLDCYEHASACMCYTPRVHSSQELIQY